MPLTAFGLVIGGLSLVGIPGTAGFITKWYLVLAAIERDYWWLVALIVASSLIAMGIAAVLCIGIGTFPDAFLARTWSTSGMALGMMVILLAYLLGYYVL